jgi:ADP-ribose pyrophosphatase YjhB (NUDIX family)
LAGDALNPALAGARFCPRCARPATIAYPRSLNCAHCGYGAYYNPKPVACAIPVTPAGEIILLKRAFAPGKDLWTFPGGFVDLGESVEQAAIREVREELAIDVELGALVGVYSRADDRIVLIVFAATTSQAPSVTEEAVDVGHYALDALPWSELAFWSTTAALRDFVHRNLS